MQRQRGEWVPIGEVVSERRFSSTGVFGMSYKIIDLFCGAGGMTLGFVEPRFCGGFRCVLAVDSDRSSIATHHSNFGGRVVCRNIEEWL